MNGRERGFLLLSSQLGDPERQVLTVAQLRTLALRAAAMKRPTEDRELTDADLNAMIYAHPTLSEAIHEAVLAADGRAIHA